MTALAHSSAVPPLGIRCLIVAPSTVSLRASPGGLPNMAQCPSRHRKTKMFERRGGGTRWRNEAEGRGPPEHGSVNHARRHDVDPPSIRSRTRTTRSSRPSRSSSRSSGDAKEGCHAAWRGRSARRAAGKEAAQESIGSTGRATRNQLRPAERKQTKADAWTSCKRTCPRRLMHVRTLKVLAHLRHASCPAGRSRQMQKRLIGVRRNRPCRPAGRPQTAWPLRRPAEAGRAAGRRPTARPPRNRLRAAPGGQAKSGPGTTINSY